MNKKGITLIELIVIIAISLTLISIVAGAYYEAKSEAAFEDYEYVIADGQTYDTDEIKRIGNHSFWTDKNNHWNKESYTIVFKNGGRQDVSGYYFSNNRKEE